MKTKTILAVLAAFEIACLTLVAEETETQMTTDSYSWNTCGNVEFLEDGSIAMSVPETQGKSCTYISLTKVLPVQPGDKFILHFKAKGSGGKFMIAGFGSHGSKKFRFGDKSFKVESDKFSDLKCELTITKKKIFDGIVEKASPAIMINGTGCKLVIKDIKILFKK